MNPSWKPINPVDERISFAITNYLDVINDGLGLVSGRAGGNGHQYV